MDVSPATINENALSDVDATFKDVDSNSFAADTHLGRRFGVAARGLPISTVRSILSIWTVTVPHQYTTTTRPKRRRT